MDNKLFKEAFDKVEDGIVNAMKTAPMGDEKTHNRLVIALQLLNQIEKHIKTVAETGKMAEIQSQGGILQKLQGIA